ncbi:MAG TPA: sulfur transferase domain-containing protein [Vicinamibacterales bacterium]|nr:sulfur transferase domain-containing protein [Vicinamibacterales bacterium]
MRSVTTLVVLALAIPAAAQVTKQERPGIVNFSKVDAVVACGGATETSALEGLAKDGFKSVINLRLATEANANIDQNAARTKELGMKYIHIPFNAQQPDDAVVDAFLAAVADKSNQPAYIHCGSASRVGSLWLVKRVLQDGWTIDKATEEAKAIGLRGEPLEKFALNYIATRKK